MTLPLILSLITVLSSAQATSLEIPLKSSQNWIELKYSSLPANKVSFTSQGLSIEVENSASPLIYPLPKETKIKAIQIHARVEGSLSDFKNKTQGAKGADDFTLRLGLVESGNKTLSIWKKPFAASWVKKLFSLAPKGSGIEKILFLNVPQNSDLTGKSRVHPLSDLIEEIFLSPADSKRLIRINHSFKKPLKTVALWISSDGDDTQSKYRIVISKIKLIPVDPQK